MTSALRGVLVAVVMAAVMAGCGSSSSGGSGASGSATTVVDQAFSSGHVVNSGNLDFMLSLTPSGSSAISGPITLGFAGPFESMGKGKVPASDFNISFSALGQSGSLSLISTGSAGYVTVSGNSYQLPASTYQKIAGSFAGLTNTGSGSSFGSLGIDPKRWLTNPQVVGQDTVGGTATTHVRAQVNVSQLLNDLNNIFKKASSTVAAAKNLPALSSSEESKIAASIKNPTVDVWAGNGDHALRKLVVNLTIPVTGQISALLGGLSSVAVSLTMQYTNLNQQQTITAPSKIQPYSQFQQKLNSLLGAIKNSAAASVLGGGSASAGATASSGSSTGTATTPGSISKYAQCIQSANGDVTKMQACGSLIGH
jgi:hypothetical protein